MPSEIIAEIERLPTGFMEQVLEYRRFAEAKSEYDHATTKEARIRLRSYPFGALAEQIGMELKHEAIVAAQNAEAHG